MLAVSAPRRGAMAAAVAAALVAILTSTLGAPAAEAVNVGGFEIDGDFAVNAGGLDWNALPGQPSAKDAIGSGTDDNFAGGAKEQDTSSWQLLNSSVSPAANDIGNLYGYGALVGGQQYAFIGFERAVSGGTTMFNVELNQNSDVRNSYGVLVPNRQPGDLLIDIQQQASGTPTVGGVYRWDGSQWVAIANGASGVTGASNSTVVTNPLGQILQPGTFAELGVNLSQVFGIPACPGVTFNAINMRSRASTSITSQVKDYVQPGAVSVPTSCGALSIDKRDPAGNRLPGATFTISPNPIPLATGTLTVTDGSAQDPDGAANGVINFANAPPATYTVTETGAPTGYVLDTTSKTTTVTTGNLSTVTVTNRLGTASWQKLDDITGQPVPAAGATFQLTPTGGAAATLGKTLTVVDNGTNDTDPATGALKVTGLYTGTYQLTETAPPDGYTLPTTGNPKTFTVSATAGEATIPAFRDPRKTGTITVAKTDADTGASLDATFQLWRDNGDGTFSAATDQKVGTAQTTSNGTLRYDQLAWGTYWVQETQAPAGYQLAPGSPFKVTIGATNLAATINVADPQRRTTLTLVKTDAPPGATGGARLAGATFQLYKDANHNKQLDAGDPTLGDPKTTDTSGTTSWAGLLFDDYLLVETRAPAGHALLAQPVAFAVSPTGTTLTGGTSTAMTLTQADPASPTLTIGDPQALVLPMTGGSGTWPVTLAGLGILALAAVLWALLTRRQRSRRPERRREGGEP